MTGPQLADALLPTMFASTPPAALAAAFGDSMRAFHPLGFRAMARAAAEDLRPLLADVVVPTLLIYGDRDVRAARAVADHLHATLSDSTLVTLAGVGHVCNLEAPDRFNEVLRDWLRAHP